MLVRPSIHDALPPQVHEPAHSPDARSRGLRSRPLAVPREERGLLDAGEAQDLLREPLQPDGKAAVGRAAVLEDRKVIGKPSGFRPNVFRFSTSMS